MSTEIEPVQFQETEFNIEKAYVRGFQDFQFFAKLAAPEVMAYDFPDLYIGIWIMIAKATNEKARARLLRYLLGLPRGFAKTTFIKILICWLIVYDKINFPLLVCATEDLARLFLADIDSILGSPNMEKVYGAWTANKAVDNNEMKKAMYRKHVVTIKAIGAGTSVRGINVDNDRPDCIACDDMQTKENSESDTDSFRLLVWFTGTLLKCVTPLRPSVIIYSGNMYPSNCILLKLSENSHWTSLITGCILADGRSLWEKLHPIESLYEVYKHDESLGLAYIWFAEMMNQPILEKVSLLPNGMIPTCPFVEVEDLAPEAGFIVIDPAGFKNGADDNVIAAFLVKGDKVYCKKMVAGNLNPEEVIKAAITMALELDIRVIFIEAVAYQQTLKFWFNITLKQKNLAEHFILVDITPRNKAKEGRIRVSVQQLLAGTWYLMDVEARQQYTFQALKYKIGKPKQRDDILDTCAYIEEVRTPEHWSVVLSYPLQDIRESNAPLLGAVTPF